MNWAVIFILPLMIFKVHRKLVQLSLKLMKIRQNRSLLGDIVDEIRLDCLTRLRRAVRFKKDRVNS
ncbi:hypothetical protein [Halobacillus campisalis]|uniref:hypothetical protein n=1 Tax=Halobacillus campisalis TaxID=435909 RepID=UPI0036F36FB8